MDRAQATEPKKGAATMAPNAETRIYRIEEGSLVCIPFPVDEPDQLKDMLVQIAGHDRFVMLIEPPGEGAEVIGPADIIEGLEAAGVVG